MVDCMMQRSTDGEQKERDKEGTPRTVISEFGELLIDDLSMPSTSASDVIESLRWLVGGLSSISGLVGVNSVPPSRRRGFPISIVNCLGVLE